MTTKKIENKKDDKKALMPVNGFTAIDIYTNDGLTDVLANIKKEVSSFVPDLKTAEGRKSITSLAYNVTRSKTYLDDIGKEMVSEWKEKAKSVDAKRRWMRDELDALRDDLKAPLVEWQEKDAARIEKISGIINSTIMAGKSAIEGYASKDLDELFKTRTEIDAIDPEDGFGDFKDRLTEVRLAALDQIDAAISNRSKYDAEQAELEELRAEKNKRDEADRLAREEQEKKDRIAREDKERKAHDKKVADEAKAKAEAREKQAIKEKEDAEKRADQAIEDAKKRTEQAEQAEKDAKAGAEKDAREKLAREQQAVRDEQAKRERNTKHRAKINNGAVDAIIKASGATPDIARKIVIAIAKGKITNVTINY